MNEKQAYREGLHFTGAYAGLYDKTKHAKMKEEAAAIRKSGFRAVLVTTDSGSGTSIYAEQAYFDNKEMIELERQISGHEARQAGAKRRYEEELRKLDEEQEKYISRLTELKERNR